ncbi:hypothetical protein EXW96_26700 [Paenibacillus sp. JMULE4]|uniref:hypothetical protein n=1 Tax=Paenibacillus sp. JMULE4 TaxID=2518342 RepID=UPI00157727FE|nr:hypothetical protein [Paenibacillus sp. JMULE4]NTZ20980.1 hypothetical protein [Paenibacillus sp. JMULE4]
MSNVIELFSRKSLEQLSERNRVDDNWVENNGKYIGVLTQSDHQAIKSMINEMALLNEQNERILRLWDQANERYQGKLAYCLSYLEVYTPKENRIDLEKDELVFDKDGHVWVIYGGKIKNK